MIDLQGFSDRICAGWKLPPIEIIYAPLVGGRGEYDNLSDFPVIRLDSQFFAYREHPLMVVEILHELRHYYQDMHYHDVLAFWENHASLYNKYYFDPVVATEYDARMFSWSFGKLAGISLLDEFQYILDIGVDAEAEIERLKPRFDRIAGELGLFRYHDVSDSVMENISVRWKNIWSGFEKPVVSHGFDVHIFSWGTAVFDNAEKKWIRAFFSSGAEVILENSSAVCVNEGIFFDGDKEI